MEYLILYKCGICGESYDNIDLVATCEERRKVNYSYVSDSYVTVFDGDVKGDGVLTGPSRYKLFGGIHLKFMEVKFDSGDCRFVPCHYIIPRTGA